MGIDFALWGRARFFADGWRIRRLGHRQHHESCWPAKKCVPRDTLWPARGLLISLSDLRRGFTGRFNLSQN
jgi:hypothetical protein